MAVTIKDVAKAAGTSTATVSKVMNGSYSISQETIDRVNRVMEELNYHPNTRARNLSHQANRTIFFVAALDRNTGFLNPHMFEMLCGIEHTLSKKGYSLVVKGVLPSEAAELVKESSDTKVADGFILHASAITKELDEVIYKNEIPHLVLGMPDFDSHFCWIDVDNKYAGEVAVKHLLACGYCSVAYIGGTDDDRISEHRLSGVLSVLNRHEVIRPQNYVQQGKSVTWDGYEMTKQVLSGNSIPEAIICANNYLAYGCVNAISDAGLQIPRDIGVLTFDNYPFSQLLNPQLTVVDIDVYDLGSEAGKTILQIIKKPTVHVQSYFTCPTVIERDSTKPRENFKNLNKLF